MTGLMSNKKGIIFGVSNKRGIGYAIAKSLFDAGAEIAFTYAGDVMKDRVTPIAESMNSKLITSCDVTSDEDIERVVDEFVSKYGKCDFIIHAVAFANREDLEGNFSSVSRNGWNTALDVSAYSFVAISNRFKAHLNDNASLVALSYLGGERSVPNYNVMGVAKAALEASVRYLASEFGELGVRVNAISAGPVKTLAAKGISGFDILLKVNAARSPMKRNITLDEVGNSALYLCSHLSSGVTGETHHVDCGYHSIATSREDAKIIGINAS
ncbi:MAG: enoyl-ACP reductase [Candidatus Margulisiibacteriota bacterium]